MNSHFRTAASPYNLSLSHSIGSPSSKPVAMPTATTCTTSTVRPKITATDSLIFWEGGAVDVILDTVLYHLGRQSWLRSGPDLVAMSIDEDRALVVQTLSTMTRLKAIGKAKVHVVRTDSGRQSACRNSCHPLYTCDEFKSWDLLRGQEIKTNQDIAAVSGLVVTVVASIPCCIVR